MNSNDNNDKPEDQTVNPQVQAPIKNQEGPNDPPMIERDLITGKPSMNKREAVQAWFKKAKKNSLGDKPFQRNIDPKQAFYAECKKRRKK